MATVHKDFESEIPTGEQSEIPVRYWIKGIGNYDGAEFEARAELIAQCDPVYDGRLPTKATVVRRGPTTWEGTVIYSAQEWEYNFEISTQEVLVTQALQTVNRYPRPGQTAPDFKGCIGVTRDGIQGTQVPVPISSWSETHYFDFAAVDDTYKDDLESLVGKCNNATFRRKQKGTVIFDGATGGIARGQRQWVLNFKFRHSPTVTGLTIGDISGITKRGWDYLWVHYIEFPDVTSQRLVRIPDSVHVERVIPEGDFSKMRLPA